MERMVMQVPPVRCPRERKRLSATVFRSQADALEELAGAFDEGNLSRAVREVLAAGFEAIRHDPTHRYHVPERERASLAQG